MGLGNYLEKKLGSKAERKVKLNSGLAKAKNFGVKGVHVLHGIGVQGKAVSEGIMGKATIESAGFSSGIDFGVSDPLAYDDRSRGKRRSRQHKRHLKRHGHRRGDVHIYVH